MTDNQALKVVEAMNKRQFEAYYCKTSQEALEKALTLIPENHTVSWGGSVTLDQIGLIQAVKNKGYKVIDRATAKNPEERIELMRKALTAETFLMSSNAITEDGQLLNVDGNGNRVAALCFGPKQVIVVAGTNKIVPSWEDAYNRVLKVAAPLNAKRLSSAEKEVKVENIFCQVVTTRVSLPSKKIKVILVGEELGF